MAFITGKEEESAPGMAVLDASNTQKPGLGRQQGSGMTVAPSVSAKRRALQKMGTKSKVPQKFVSGGIVDKEDTDDSLKQLSSGIQSQGGGSFSADRPSTQKGSGTFTNLKSYADANKEKTQKMGQAVSGGIKEAATKLSGDIAGKRVSSLGEGSSIAKESTRLDTGEKIIRDTVAAAGSGQEVDSGFGSFYGGTTNIDTAASGPQLYKEQKGARDLSERAKGLTTSRGITSESAKTVGKQSPQYTGGQRSLDSFLLSGKRGAQAVDSRGVRQATSGLGQQASSLEGDFRGELSSQALQRKALQERAGTAVTDATTGVTDAVGQQTSDLRSKQEFLRQKLESGSALSPDELMSIGINPSASGASVMPGQTFGRNLRDFVNMSNVTDATSISADQASRLNALNQLAGKTDQGLVGGSGQIASGGQAYVNEVAGVQQEYDIEKASLTSSINEIKAEANRLGAEAYRAKDRGGAVNTVIADQAQIDARNAYLHDNNIEGLVGDLNNINNKYGFVESTNPTYDQLPGGVSPSKDYGTTVPTSPYVETKG